MDGGDAGNDGGPMPFRDRREAGRQLAERVSGLRDSSPLVLGLPRGGVPVAYEVAEALGAPLDVLIVRKLGVPYQPELGMGAVGEDGVRVLNPVVLRHAGVSESQLAEVEARERGAERVVLAVPVAPGETVASLRRDADDVVCVETPEPFFAIGGWYTDFSPTSEHKVVELLNAARDTVDGADRVGEEIDQEINEEVEIPAGPRRLPGRVTVPAGAVGLVAFAHGSGSGRHSPRNQAVARALNDAGLGTLLFDLLSPDEGADRANVFDIPLLADRLGAATTFLLDAPAVRALPLGYFGASTGAGAELWAAAEPGSPVQAVVSRGGRPDLARDRLDDVRAPTLLIVGGNDDAVLELKREAAGRLRGEHRIEVVPGATHLFEEPGALDVVADLASDWFVEHLTLNRP